jgi:predicted N-acetyltransferase YhbS
MLPEPGGRRARGGRTLAGVTSTDAPAVPPRALPGGLALRQGTPQDLDQIADLLVRRGEEADALDHRLVVEDPDAGWESCAVVVDGDRVVSTATLLDETLRCGGVDLPAGQVELVATDTAYEGRGLVRALMGWAHERSAARGHVVQVMIGIPYFYRLFGYEYAIDIPRPRPVTPTGDGDPSATFRRARPDDLAAVTAMHDDVQRGVDVAMPHSPPRRRWLLQHDGSTTWVVERAGTPVATARTQPPEEDGVLAAEAAAVDEDAARTLLHHLAALVPGGELQVVDRPGTVASLVAAGRAGTEGDAEQYYVRIPDAGVLLDRLRPVLWQRLLGSGLDRAGRDLVISTFGRHHRLAVRDDGLGAPVTGGPMQAPGAAGGMAVAPDQLGALLFGPLGVVGLTRRRPDVYPGRDRELYAALFPPLTADLLTYYLPW